MVLVKEVECRLPGPLCARLVAVSAKVDHVTGEPQLGGHATPISAHPVSLTGLPRRNAEVALRRVGEEIIGGVRVRGWGLGGRGPEETANPGGDDARVHAEER